MNGFSKVCNWDREADWKSRGMDVDVGAKNRFEGSLCMQI